MITQERAKNLEAQVADLQNLVVAENHRKQQLEEQVAKQSAALKMARDALGKLSLYVAYNGDDWVKRNSTDALAAIDALGE